MKGRPQFLLAGALLIAVMALAGLNQRLQPDGASGDRGACCPLLSLPGGLLPTAGTNGAASHTNPPAVTNLF